MFKLLFLSTPVGFLGSGIGGGVELSLYNVAKILLSRGHQIQVVAPASSVLPEIPIIEIAGNLQISAQSQERDTPICLPPNSVLENMWDYARQVQTEYDLIVNFAYDWLPFYLTPFFHRPIAHFITMASLSTAMDQIIQKIYAQFPQTLGFYSKVQAETFGIGDKGRYLSSAIDLSLYEFCNTPESHLAWCGRIAPEKALEDAVAACDQTGVPLKIFGKIQDPQYWQKICQDYPNAPIEYVGFLSTDELQRHLRKSRALIMTPRWVEAFGNVVIEALACGVPVIAYRRGGPAEIIEQGKTGFLVEPDDVMALVSAIERLDEIDRLSCRISAETHYSLDALGDRFEAWFKDIIAIA
ncbi:glycosyltransferase family 4 protein [Gloeothece verrucosa]|uniref:Glycosyl transferase group 1 n=1 Tax=Gloeothece verrucosa (strain PCC 7822) TaxID=497965 RepID=E0UB70_GLOV7|nr:glycosyltransferase family 4 protein [Gloeothece verrucosa]ADN16315.1 glycosyl transferase group 1 [Gloeothece verrucosa PCC 7822]